MTRKDDEAILATALTRVEVDVARLRDMLLADGIMRQSIKSKGKEVLGSIEILKGVVRVVSA